MMTKEARAGFRDLYDRIGEMSTDEDRLLPRKDRLDRIERSKVDPLFFYQTYLSRYFTNEPADFHSQLPENFQVTQIPIVICAPRGGAKSTIVFAESLRLIVTGLQKFLIRVEESEVIARKEIYKLKAELESNYQLIEDFGELRSTPWTASELYLSNGTMIWGRGRRQPVRGVSFRNWRPTGIIYNDIETPEQVANSKLTDRIYNALITEALPALQPAEGGGGFLGIVGTMLGSDCVLNKMLNHPLAIPIYYTALKGDEFVIDRVLDKISDDAEDIGRWMKKYKGKSKAKVALRRSFFHKREDYNVLVDQLGSYWPDRYPVEELLLSAAAGVPAFKQEYLHIPYDDEQNQVFKPTWFKRESNNYYITQIPHQNLVRAIFLDPSYKDSATSDNKAFLVGFYDIENQEGYIVDAVVKQMSYEEMVRTAFELSQTYLYDDVVLRQVIDGETRTVTFERDAFIDSMFGYEDNGGQVFLENVFRDNSEKYGFVLPKLQGITHMSNKHARISRLSYYVERSKIKFDRSQDMQQIVISELTHLGDRRHHDDGADALEGLWAIVERTAGTIPFAKQDKPLNWYDHTPGKISFREALYDPQQRQRYIPKSQSRRLL